MHHIILVMAAALVATGCRAANANRHLKLLDFENDIEPHSTPAKPVGLRRFLSLGRTPRPAYVHAPGTVTALTCEAMGSPAPSIRWFRNNAPVYEHESDSNEIIQSNPTSLGRATSTLLVTHADSADEYTCLASSGNKVTRATTIVHGSGTSSETTERWKLLPRAPRIVARLAALVDTIGSRVVLPCRARGHPRPLTHWTDNNGLPVSGPRMKVLKSGALLISPLRWSDMGEFTCHATNAFGNESSSTFLYPAAG
ncbi:hypothetical protein ACJJTC_000252 [Scirpophaga incertulas]